MMTSTVKNALKTSIDKFPPFHPNPHDEANAESLLRHYVPKIVSEDHVEKHIRLLMSLEGGFVDRLNYISSWIPESVKAKLLVSGCAAASEMIVARQFGFQRICGTEVSEELVTICKKRLATARGFEIIHYDGMRLPYPDNTFSMIMSGHIIEHTRSPFHYFREHMRVLKPEGWLFLEFPNRYHYVELHTGLLSVEYLPSLMRSLVLRYLASPLSPCGTKKRESYENIRKTLQPISIGKIRRYLRSLKWSRSSRIVHHYKPAPGYVRMLIVKKHPPEISRLLLNNAIQ